jgi:branched-chain amino acid transport system permease protein
MTLSLAALGSQILIGLSRGMILFMVASGLTLVFGVLRINNFAHGTLYMIGAYLAYTVTLLAGQNSGGFWLALLIAPLTVALLSLVIERGLLRFIYKRDHLMQMLLTYSLILILGDLVKMLWGTEYKTFAMPAVLSGAITLGDISLPIYNLFLLIVGPCVAVLLWYFLTRTRLGKLCRATATDREMVDVLGRNSTWVFAFVFALGGWLAGLGGTLIAPTTNIALGMDSNINIYAFLIVVSGGLGNIWGALICSVLIGLGEALGVLFLPGMAIVIPYLIIGLILIVRPAGLLKSAW